MGDPTRAEFAESMNEHARNEAERIELRRNPPKNSPSIDDALRAHYTKEDKA
jgi:hypothetical protein